MQHRIVVSYRRFGTTFRSHLRGPSIPRISVKSRIPNVCVRFAECCIFVIKTRDRCWQWDCGVESVKVWRLYGNYAWYRRQTRNNE